MSEGNLMYHPRLAWDKAQQWGEKAKMGLNRKNMVKQIKESSGGVGWGKGAGAWGHAFDATIP